MSINKEMLLATLSLVAILILGWASHERLSRAFGWPDVATPYEKWAEHMLSLSEHCGQLGGHVYAFPRHLVRWTVEYEGDKSWTPRTDWRIKGCADNFKGLSFRFRFPEMALVEKKTDLDTFAAINVYVSQGRNKKYVQDIIKSFRRAPGLVVSRQFDKEIGLDSFDIVGEETRRVFWRIGSSGADDLFIVCSVSSANPQCEVHLISFSLDAQLAISMAMKNLTGWAHIVTGVESAILRYVKI